MMQTVLVTGGAGTLGRPLIDKLHAAGHGVRGTSRRARPAWLAPAVDWVSADLGTGEGLAAALAGVNTVIHAASSPSESTRKVDVEGTGQLLALCKSADVAHFVYISIVGIDRIPYAYYQHKLAAEQVVANGGVPWTILRATQFHDLLDLFIRRFTRLPVVVAPLDFQYQVVDAGEVAQALCALVGAGPAGRAPDMGGPEVQTAGTLMRAWLHARGLRRLVLPLPTLGKAAYAFKHGYNTCPQNRQGKITWEQWLRRTYGGGAA